MDGRARRSVHSRPDADTPGFDVNAYFARSGILFAEKHPVLIRAKADWMGQVASLYSIPLILK